MKVKIFCAEEEDKKLYPKYMDQSKRLELTFVHDDLTLENAQKETKGFQAVVILTRCIITGQLSKILKECGVKYVLTRSAGFDHLDLNEIKMNGLKAANVPLYSPNAISEYVCMTTLMLLRKMKEQIAMIGDHNYTLKGIRGRELRNQTVGIVGTGRIGCETLKIFSAFTNKILVHDIYEKDSVKSMASYVTLDELYQKCDIIIFHCPLTKENHHMVNEETIAMMKDGVILVNPARGGLMDYSAVLKGLKSGKIAGLISDVYENEKQYLRKKLGSNAPETDAVIKELVTMNNCIYTAHSAFYTDMAIENMIESIVRSLYQYEVIGSCECDLIK